MITKIFLCNLVAVITMGIVDKHVLSDAILDSKWMIYPFGTWAALSLLSIPAWAIYLIWTW